jgi:putative SOS response-associated peptidase YedK
LQRMLVPYPAEGMVAYPVSERVNSPAADDERVIEPVKGL